jgi:hypothetical protein
MGSPGYLGPVFYSKFNQFTLSAEEKIDEH